MGGAHGEPAMGGPMGARPGGGMGIQGPVALGQGGAGPVQPFAEVAQQEVHQDSGASRTRSLRLVAILAAMFLMLGGTILVGGVALFLAINPEILSGESSGSSSSSSDGDLIGDESEDDLSDDEEDDDEEVEAFSGLKKPSARRRSRGSSSRSGSSRSSSRSGSTSSSGSSTSGSSGSASSGSSGSGSSSSSSSRGRSAPKSGPFSIKVTGGAAKSVKFSCDDGASGQISLSSGSGSSGKSVGSSAACSLSFKSVSGVPKKGSISGGGRSYTCDLSGPRANCK